MAENTREKQEQKKLMAEKLWLNYFNQTLYENGFLTEGQRNRLKLIIDSRKSSAKGTRGRAISTPRGQESRQSSKF